MKGFPALLVAILLAAVTLAGCQRGLVPEETGDARIIAFESGQAYRSEGGSYWILELAGDWHQMGRQYGGLAGREMRKFHQEIVADLTARGVSLEHCSEVARDAYSHYSPDLQQLLIGMSETSEMTLDEVLVLNAGMMLLTEAVLEGRPPSACSGIAVWGDYSQDKELVFGRNWDIDRKSMSRYMKYLAVVVFHPAEGNALANIHPLGNVYLETGMNSQGLFIELNNAEQSDSEWHPERQDTASVLVRVLNESSGVKPAVDMLKAEPADIAYILQCADPEGAVSLERATFASRVRENDDAGLVIAYNSFVPPYPQEWEGLVSPPPASTTDPRYDNMVKLAQSHTYKGRFNPELMMQFLEVPIEEGGAYHDGTVLQVVAVPASKTIWIRGCDYGDWEEIPLADLLQQ